MGDAVGETKLSMHQTMYCMMLAFIFAWKWKTGNIRELNETQQQQQKCVAIMILYTSKLTCRTFWRTEGWTIRRAAWTREQCQSDNNEAQHYQQQIIISATSSCHILSVNTYLYEGLKVGSHTGSTQNTNPAWLHAPIFVSNARSPAQANLLVTWPPRQT